MTLLQETYERMKKLSEKELNFVLIVVKELEKNMELTSTNENDKEISRKKKAFLRLEELRNDMSFPDDFDYIKAREEGMSEKYGDFM